MAGQNQTDTGKSYLTFGPTSNEVSTDYQTRDGAHTIVFANKVSPDMIVVHQSKMAGFYIKLQSDTEIEPTVRAVKDAILKDTVIEL